MLAKASETVEGDPTRHRLNHQLDAHFLFLNTIISVIAEYSSGNNDVDPTESNSNL